jgi:hypothetical protein
MSPARILLVEDNQHDELLTLRAMRKVNLGNLIDIVRDGQQALDFLFAEGEFAGRAGLPLPVLVILDINLPRVDGINVLKLLRADPRTCLLPIVMLTSSDEESDRIRSYQDGANSFVRKPIEFDIFAETVGRLGVYWVMTNVPPVQG